MKQKTAKWGMTCVNLFMILYVQRGKGQRVTAELQAVCSAACCLQYLYDHSHLIDDD